ncbi:hypothetical protein PV326_004569 [Microctonus aethiopoides]|nr:hypothetical protein PV326_004569 [Microctonus aethiopoides]
MGLTCYICRRKASKVTGASCTGTSAAGQHRTGSRRLHESTIIEDLTNMVEKEMTKKKRIWTRKWIGDRAVRCGSTLLLKQLRSENPAEYRLALRLIPKNFDESLIESSIQRQDTMMREALSAKIKLEVTLTYLATDFSILFTSK